MNLRTLFIIGLALALAFPVRAQTPTPDPSTLLADCAATLPADRPLPTGADAPTIRIVSPASGTVIRSRADKFAEVTITVEVSGFSLDGPDAAENSPHWHVWLNNSVWGMAYQNSALVGIPYGRWRICASLSDSAHTDIGQPDGIYLIVEREEEVAPVSDDVATPLPLVIALGMLAVMGGGWLGLRRRHPAELGDHREMI